MCRRNTQDPLIRAFLDTYGLNLLAIPRADAAVGDLYVVTNDSISAPGALSTVLTPDLHYLPKKQVKNWLTSKVKCLVRSMQKLELLYLRIFFSDGYGRNCTKNTAFL